MVEAFPSTRRPRQRGVHGGHTALPGEHIVFCLDLILLREPGQRVIEKEQAAIHRGHGAGYHAGAGPARPVVHGQQHGKSHHLISIGEDSQWHWFAYRQLAFGPCFFQKIIEFSGCLGHGFIQIGHG